MTVPVDASAAGASEAPPQRNRRAYGDTRLALWLLLASVIVRIVALMASDHDDSDGMARLILSRAVIDHGVLLPTRDWLPGHYLVLAVPLLMGLKGQVYARLWTALLSAMAVPLTFLLLRDAFGRRAALTSSLLLGLSALHVRFSVLTVSEGPFVTLLLIGLLTFVRYLDSGQWRYLLAGAAAIAFAGSMRFEAWLLPIVVVIAGVVPTLVGPTDMRDRSGRGRTVAFAIAGAVFPTIWAAFFYLNYGDALYIGGETLAQDFPRATRIASLRYAVAFWPGLIMFSMGPIVTALAACGSVVSLRAGQSSFRLWLLGHTLLVMLLLMYGRRVQARYGVTLTVLLLLFAGPGLEWLCQTLRGVIRPARFRAVVYLTAIAWLFAVPMISAREHGWMSQKMASVSPAPRFDRKVREVNDWLRQNRGRDGAIVLLGLTGPAGTWLSLADDWYDIQLKDRYIDRQRDSRQLYFVKSAAEALPVIRQTRRGYLVLNSAVAEPLAAALTRAGPAVGLGLEPVFQNDQFAVLQWGSSLSLSTNPTQISIR